MAQAFLVLQNPALLLLRPFDRSAEQLLKHLDERLHARALLTAQRSPATTASGITAQLRDLANLRDEGILTEEEFRATKTSFLSKIDPTSGPQLPLTAMPSPTRAASGPNALPEPHSNVGERDIQNDSAVARGRKRTMTVVIRTREFTRQQQKNP